MGVIQGYILDQSLGSFLLFGVWHSIHICKKDLYFCGLSFSLRVPLKGGG